MSTTTKTKITNETLQTVILQGILAYNTGEYETAQKLFSQAYDQIDYFTMNDGFYIQHAIIAYYTALNGIKILKNYNPQFWLEISLADLPQISTKYFTEPLIRMGYSIIAYLPKNISKIKYDAIKKLIAAIESQPSLINQEQIADIYNELRQKETALQKTSAPLAATSLSRNISTSSSTATISSTTANTTSHSSLATAIPPTTTNFFKESKKQTTTTTTQTTQSYKQQS